VIKSWRLTIFQASPWRTRTWVNGSRRGSSALVSGTKVPVKVIRSLSSQRAWSIVFWALIAPVFLKCSA
jgi:hypothetical protein